MAARVPNAAQTTVETTAGPPVGALIPQPHGGALRHGGPNKGGPGAVPSELRRRLTGSFADRVEVIEQIADGVPVKRVEVPLAALLPHVRCPRCQGKLRAADVGSEAVVTIEAQESASPADRLKALDLAAKYSDLTQPKAIDLLTSDDLRDRMIRHVQVTHRVLTECGVAPETIEKLFDAQHQEVWS